MRNQYKLAVLVQFSTLLLCLGSLMPRGFFSQAVLKRLLVLTTILRFFKMDASSGEFIALSKEDFSRMLHILLIIGTLDLVMFEKAMRMRLFRRKNAEQNWKANAKTKALT